MITRNSMTRNSTMRLGSAFAPILAGSVSLSISDVKPAEPIPCAEFQSSSTVSFKNGPVGLADVVDRVKHAVVSMKSQYIKNLASPQSPESRCSHERIIPFAGRAMRPLTSHGAGFCISDDGHTVTNHHVIDESQTVEVITDEGLTHKAKVIAGDPESDLALIKVDGRTDFPFVRFADKAPRVGDWVFAVGNPFGLGGTVTAGIVSALDRHISTKSYDSLIQIDAHINKGNSGGPSFDLDGNVVGVNSIIFSPSGGSVERFNQLVCPNELKRH